MKKKPVKRTPKRLDVATATMKQLDREYARTWGSQDADTRAYYHQVQQEIVRRQEIAYRERYPDLALGAVTCQGTLKRDSVDWKRFYIEGITIEAKCPTCGGIIDSVGDYLHYPPMGEPFWAKAWCEGCYEKNNVYSGHRAVLQINVSLSSPMAYPKDKKEAK